MQHIEKQYFFDREDAMYTGSRATHSAHKSTPSMGRMHHLTYQDLYEAIDKGIDFNEAQLIFLSCLVKRKLKAFDPRFDFADLEMKPYK